MWLLKLSSCTGVTRGIVPTHAKAIKTRYALQSRRFLFKHPTCFCGVEDYGTEEESSGQDSAKAPAAPKPKFPRATLENALKIPTAASRDYRLTSGTRESPQIALEELGHEIVYAPDPATELTLKKASLPENRYLQAGPRLLQGKQSSRHEVPRERTHQTIRS